MDIRLIFLNQHGVVKICFIKGQPLSGLWCFARSRAARQEVIGERAKKRFWRDNRVDRTANRHW